MPPDTPGGQAVRTWPTGGVGAVAWRGGMMAAPPTALGSAAVGRGAGVKVRWPQRGLWVQRKALASREAPLP